MRGNSFGKLFSVVSFGESHGPAVGVVIDGVPAGLSFSMDELRQELKRRAPGQVKGTTSRKEADEPEVLSGIFENQTMGTPIAVIVKNTNQRSEDYSKIKKDLRPGHADETYIQKYGVRDHRGGGRSSGRETVARVIAGYFASLIIPQIEIFAFASQMGTLKIDKKSYPESKINFGPYNFPSIDSDEVEKYLLDLKAKGDSCGGKVRLVIKNCPSGLGEPAFDKLKADISKALMSIGACVGVSIGAGSELVNMSGQEAASSRDNYGGIEGGISNGRTIQLEILIKPTSTVGDKAKEGRHDPCIVPRVIPVIEAMAKVIIADHYLRQLAYQIGTSNV